MKLSIIIPIYNEAKYLRRCLDSVTLLGKGNVIYEVIAIDDCSTDGSDEILREYSDRVRCFFLEKNEGVSFARNLGIKEARGEYVTFLDSDDRYVDGAIVAMFRAIEERKADVIQFNHFRCDADGNQIQRFAAKSGTYPFDKLPPKWVLCWNKVYRREFLLEHGISFRYGMQLEEDRIFNLECFNFLDALEVCQNYIVAKHFDNKQSLCHSIDRDKILRVVDELTALLHEDLRPNLYRVIANCIADQMNSKNFKEVFG